MYQSPSIEHLTLYHKNEVLYKQFVLLAICFSQCPPLAMLHRKPGNFVLLIFHFCGVWKLRRNYFHQRDQNSPTLCCTCLHRIRESRSGLLNNSGGGIKTSLFMARRLLGDNIISLLTSLRDSTVRGLELMIAFVLATSVLNPSSLKLWPWVFNKAASILLAFGIWRSQTPLICEAAGGFLDYVIQSVPFCRR